MPRDVSKHYSQHGTNFSVKLIASLKMILAAEEIPNGL